MCARLLFFKKMLRFSKWSFIVILLFFLLIIMAARNIKQTIKKDYNIQSCQWMVCDRFRQPFLISTTVCSFLCTVNYFLCAFSAKIATYSLVIDIVYSRNVQKTWANVLFECPLLKKLWGFSKGGKWRISNHESRIRKVHCLEF